MVAERRTVWVSGLLCTLTLVDGVTLADTGIDVPDTLTLSTGLLLSGEFPCTDPGLSPCEGKPSLAPRDLHKCQVHGEQRATVAKLANTMA